MKRLLLFSFFSVLLFSCKGYHGPVSDKKDYIAGEFTVKNTYFATIGEEHIFRAHISAFKKELSGLLVVKKINEQLHRVVLTSDFGNTLFDLSIYKDKYETNYVMPDLDNKIILNFLGRDFSYLVEDTYTMDGKSIQENYIVYRGKYKKKKAFAVVENERGVTEIIAANARKPKIVFTYAKNETGLLKIKHKNFPLEISLTPLETK